MYKCKECGSIDNLIKGKNLCQSCKYKKTINKNPNHNKDKYKRELEKDTKYNKNHYNKSRDRRMSYSKNHYNNNKDIHRNYSLNKLYGISLEEYNNKLIEQDFKCKICGTHISNLTKNLFVDHNHSNGKIRGLLCHKCNSGLGMFNENINTLTKAISYLKDNKEL